MQSSLFEEEAQFPAAEAPAHDQSKPPVVAPMEPPTDENGRPTFFPMAIQGGMLEALGINMYTTIGKCLVEFVANAHDSDSPGVDIAIPYGDIAEARESIREAAKKRIKEKGLDPFTVLLDPLPDSIEIVIEDKGHGMSPEDVYKKFMPLNRKRRMDGKGKETVNRTESGLRFVMGRKGLGKLAGFGAAEEISITTKRKGETFSTTFVMDFEVLKRSENMADVKIPATYTPGLPVDAQGTTIRLKRLKCDAVKQSNNTIEETIATAFYGIDPGDFAIRVNGKQVQATPAAYEFQWPVADVDEDGFGTDVLKLEDGMISLPFKYQVKFRARTKDPEHPELAVGSLSADKRGARIYCNRRLAAGPTLKGLPTGMHNFYATDYMECVVKADELDRATIDFVNTNRTELREDNEIVQSLMERIVEIMRVAVREHGSWREDVVSKQIETRMKESRQLRWVTELPKRQREAAKSVLKAVAVTHDINSEEFGEIAPHLMQAMNASDVLARLIHLRTDPESINKIARYLEEWQDVERQDVIKHYRARRNAIGGLAKLVQDGEEAARGAPRNEKELHQLLKKNPWLVRPEFGQFVSSDRNMTTTLSAIANRLQIDEFAPPQAATEEADKTRPDLVFALGNDPVKPYEVIIVELKSTTIPLNYEHYRQLRNYMRETDQWLKMQFEDRHVTVKGMLVGKMPDAQTKAHGEVELIRQIAEDAGKDALKVVGLQAMLEHSRVVHSNLIDVLGEEDEEGPEAPKLAAVQ